LITPYDLKLITTKNPTDFLFWLIQSSIIVIGTHGQFMSQNDYSVNDYVQKN